MDVKLSSVEKKAVMDALSAMPLRKLEKLLSGLLLRTLSCEPTKAQKKRKLLPYRQTNLVSNLEGVARFQDPLVINAWGIDITKNSIWVALAGSGYLAEFTFRGRKIRTVQVDSAEEQEAAEPTGLVINRTQNFQISRPGGVPRPARLITVTEGGTINAWNPRVADTAIIVVGTPDAVYKGVAILDSRLYVANFKQRQIEVYDSNFALLTTFTNFPTLPAGFAPFNVANIRGRLYVAFALRDADGEDDVPGPGNGFVWILDPIAGTVITRLIERGPLNSPWAMLTVPASTTCSPCSSKKGRSILLVGNFGDGRINAFDRAGNFLGPLRTCSSGGKCGQPKTGRILEIDGLWGVVKKQSASARTLFFAAGPADEENGLIGKLRNCLSNDKSKCPSSAT